MRKGMSLKRAAFAVLLAAAFLSPGLATSASGFGYREIPLWIPGLILLFGALNIFLPLPRTLLLRIVAFAIAIAELLWPRRVTPFAIFFAFLIWPVLILIAAGMSSNDAVPVESEDPPLVWPQVSAAGFVIALAVSSLAYRILVHHRLDQTSALFIGIPALLSLLVVFGVSPRSATGVACKAVTIGMLVSMMFLWEGALCIVMSAPLFYGVAVAIGGAADFARRRGARHSTLSCLMVLVLIPMSLEGVTENTSFNRDEWVIEHRIVDAPASAVSHAIYSPPRFDRPLPLYLRAGFPRATALRVERSATDTRWFITIKGGEMKLNGMEARTGTLVLRLEEARPGLMRWRVISDDSHMTHFLRWREALVEWTPTAAGTTHVTWSLRYARGLDPAWYFGPWERYAARLAAGYLIDSVATP